MNLVEQNKLHDLFRKSSDGDEKSHLVLPFVPGLFLFLLKLQHV